MKLPSGKKIFECSGGERGLKECLERVKKEKLEGYILLNTSDGENLVTGQVVFQEGKPVLADLVVGSENVSADEALKGFVQYSLSPNSTLQFREIILGPLPDIEVDKRISEGTTIEEVLKKIREEEERRKEEERKRKEILSELNSLKEKGFYLPSLDRMQKAPLKEVMEYSKRVSSALKRYEEILKVIESVKEKTLEDDKNELVKIMKNVEELAEVEKRFAEFKGKLESLEERREKIKKWIDEWKKQGYNVSLLEDKLKEDLGAAEALIVDFLDRLQRVKDVEKEIERCREDPAFLPFRKELENVARMLKDPMNVDDAEVAFEELKRAVEEDKKAKESARESVQELRSKGVDTSGAESLLMKQWREVANQWAEYLQRAEELLDLRKKVESVRDEAERDLKAQLDNVLSLLKKPEDVVSARKEYEALLRDLEEVRRERGDILSYFEDLKEKGYELGDLVPPGNTPLEVLKEAERGIRKKVEESEKIVEELKGLDLTYFPGRDGEIQNIAKDLTKLDEARSKLETLKKDVEKDLEFRETVKEEVERWEKEGFNVERVRDALTSPPKTLNEIYEDFNKRLKVATKLLDALHGMDTTYFREQVEAIEDLIRDLYSMEDAKEAIKQLERNLKEFAELRKKFSEMLKKLADEGWKVEEYREVLNGSPEDVKSSFEEVGERVEEATKHVKEVEGWDPLEREHLSERVKEVLENLKDLARLPEAIDKKERLWEEIEKRAKRREEIKKIVEDWLDSGYLVEDLRNLFEAPLEDLESAFSETERRIKELEELQRVLDNLDTRHYEADVEDLIFMNDPSRLEEFRERLENLKKKIEEDQRRRNEIAEELRRLSREGFRGAEELIKKYMDEELSMLEMHYRDFLKDVESLKRLMEKTGFVLPSTPSGEKPVDLGISPKEDFSLSKFLEDESNKDAVEAIKRMVRGEEDSHLIYIFGPSAVGKTHLLHGTALSVKDAGRNPILTTTEKFIEEFLRSVKEETLDNFREFYRGGDVLLVDNVEFLAGKSSTQEEFFHLLESLLNGGKRVVLTSDRPPSEIPEIAERLRNRFESGLVIEIKPPSEKLKRRFVKRWMEEMGISLSEEQISHLLHLENLMSLNGALKTLEGWAVEGKVDDEHVKDVVERLLGGGEEGSGDAIKEAFKNLSEKVQSLVEEEVEEGSEERKSSGSVEEEIMVKCAVCGSIIPESATVCPVCGAVFEEEEEVVVCPSCGALIPEGSTVCPSCGTEIE